MSPGLLIYFSFFTYNARYITPIISCKIYILYNDHNVCCANSPYFLYNVHDIYRADFLKVDELIADLNRGLGVGDRIYEDDIAFEAVR